VSRRASALVRCGASTANQPPATESEGALMAGNNVLELTEENFQREVLESTTPVLVDFWAVWCGPCRMIAPSIDQLAEEYAGKIKVGKVNVDDSQDLAVQYQVTSIPQVFIFKGGKVEHRIGGAQPKKVFQAAVDKVLAG
jgi:thioredoxin 1